MTFGFSIGLPPPLLQLGFSLKLSGDSREGQASLVGLEDEEEKLLKQAIAFSLEGAEEEDDQE